MNNRTPARKKQTKSTQSQPEQVQSVTIRPPRLVPGGIYTAEDIIANLEISPNTLQKWLSNRIHKLHSLDLGTKNRLFSGTTVIEFLETYRHSVNG